MRFGLYTRDPASSGQDAGAALRRGARADRQRRPARLRRVRGDRALLLPEVLHLRQPDRPVRGRRAADAGDPLPDDAARAPVPQPDRAGERDPRDDILTGGRYEWASDAGTAGSRRRRECRSTSTRAHGTRRRSTCSSRRSRTSSSRTTDVLRRRGLADRAVPDAKFRVYLGGTSDRTYKLAAEHGWSVAVPPLCRTPRSRSSSTSTASRARSTGRHPTSSGSTPAISTRTATRRSARARDWVDGFIQGNCSPLTEYEKPPTEGLERGRLRLLHRGDHGAARRDAVRAADRGGLHLGRHAARTSSSGSSRRSRSARGSRRSRSPSTRAGTALDGDQEPGAVRRAGDPALRGCGAPRRADAAGAA